MEKTWNSSEPSQKQTTYQMLLLQEGINDSSGRSGGPEQHLKNCHKSLIFSKSGGMDLEKEFDHGWYVFTLNRLNHHLKIHLTYLCHIRMQQKAKTLWRREYFFMWAWQIDDTKRLFFRFVKKVKPVRLVTGHVQLCCGNLLSVCTQFGKERFLIMFSLVEVTTLSQLQGWSFSFSFRFLCYNFALLKGRRHCLVLLLLQL